MSMSPNAVGQFSDCNENGVDDTDDLADCPDIEIVFIIDASQSMTNQQLTHVCNTINASGSTDDILGYLADAGLTVHHEIRLPALGAPLNNCPCCTGTVEQTYGDTTTGLPEVLGDCPNDEGPLEDWGPACAVVAGNKNWLAESIRLVVPITDEGPRCGSPTDDPGADRDAIENALPILRNARTAVISVIYDNASSQERDRILRIAQDFVAGAYPGGRTFRESDYESAPALARDIADRIIALCPRDCNENGVIDFCDIADGTSLDCTGYQSTCCIPQPEAGCDDPVIEDCVCNEFGFTWCCEIEWDDGCADLALTCSSDCDSLPNGVPDECESMPDCNGNDIPDVCEISCGFSTGKPCPRSLRWERAKP
jgi:hypothetical protein